MVPTDSDPLEIGHLLERAVDYGFGVQTHPLFQQGGVEPAEVVVESEVALDQLVLFQGRVLALQAALDGIADDEGATASAVVSPGAVIVDTAAELGEHQ